MSDEEESYCRLCAEPTAKTGLISAEDDVAITSKIAAKMLWINIDISVCNSLPTTICFSCFDLLERTWAFLHNVRSAQQKLIEIFLKNNDVNDLTDATAKPVDKNWEDFQATKTDVKTETASDNQPTITTVDPRHLLNIDFNVKTERTSFDDIIIDSDGFNSTDSDLPLHLTAKKKKNKKKKKVKFDTEILEADLVNIKSEVEPLDISMLCLTWDDYMCRCGICDALCKNITSLRLHSLQIHSSCCIFKCSDCGKVLNNHKSFINHVRLHKKLLRYCCEYCNKQFTMTTYIKRHRNIEHGDLFMTMCQNCGSIFDTPELLQDHINIYSKSYKKQRKRDNEMELKCEQCNKEFKSRSNLQQHKLVHTQRSRDFSCHVCGKMFFTKGTLSTHMATHEETKPYKCEFCPMSFRARGNLQSHSSLHSGAKPFVCEQCGKSFRVKRHLKSHSIVHTDLMPYVCQYCNKPFRFKTRLNLHLRQHTGAKPYKCVFCQRDFTNGSNFKKHMKRRHNIDTSRRKYNNIVNDQGLDISEDIKTDNLS